jgi:DNA (cytosine-5)-methyltransferase 1
MRHRRHPESSALHDQAARYRPAADGNPPPSPASARKAARATDSQQRRSAEEPLRPLTCLDLFCGCGGFTLGMQRAGFHVLAAIDFNPEAIATLRANLVERHHPELIPVTHALHRDLTRFHPEELARLLSQPSTTNPQPPQVDVIVGGPPCQGFSLARRRDGSNHGQRLKHDPRRHLYREFLRYVEFFQPKVFVMENVLGLRTAAGGEYFTRVQKEARALGYRVHGQIEDAWELGVPQKRRRQLVIGVRGDLPGYFPSDLKPAPRARPRPQLGAAIGDLPILRAGGGQEERAYDFRRRADHVKQAGDTALKYLCEVLEVDRAAKLTNHVARPHSERDLRDFARLREGENSAKAMRERGVEFEFPYDKSSFKDRYTRQSRWHPCSTIVAHLSKDGLMFIHPTQNRSLTPREAARVQSFPDWFRFPASRTHAFRLIGNAVPPLVAKCLGILG